MFNRVKEYLNEIIDIADKCPEKYQVKCFEVLLNSLVMKATYPVQAAQTTQVAGGQVSERPIDRFFSSHGITEEVWSQIFAIDGDSCNIIARDLKDKPVARKQKKLALLLGVKAMAETGSPCFAKEELVKLCENYASYDAKNFAKHMKDERNLLLPKDDSWCLTVPGQAKAAEVIKELAQ